MRNSILLVFSGVLFILCNATTSHGSLFSRIKIVGQTDNILKVHIGNLSDGSNQVFWLRNKYGANFTEYLNNGTTSSKDCSSAKELCIEHGEGLHLTISHLSNECVLVNYTSKSEQYLKAFFDIDQNVHIYGGPMHGQDDPRWPLKKTLSSYPYMYIDTDKLISFYQGVIEPYWLFSSGFYIYVDNHVPLHFEVTDNGLEFTASGSDKYYYEQPTQHTTLNFTMCKLDNAKKAHKHAIKKFLGTPTKIPDTQIVTQPVWNTHPRYEFQAVNESMVIDFAEKVIRNGFKPGRFDFGYKWEDGFGNSIPDTSKFPDLKGLIIKLKSLNFTVALLVPPFISEMTNPNLTEQEKSYLAKTDSQGWAFFHYARMELGGEYINTSNPDARNWFQKRLVHLRETFGFDSFNFDNGDYRRIRYTTRNLLEIIQENIKLLAEIDSNAITNVARGTQEYGLVLSMSQTEFGFDDRLTTLIPRLLHMNILGYSFTMPSIVAHAPYYLDDVELYIRDVQLRVFMPSMQFSIHRPPWMYNETIVNLVKKFVDLHEKYSSHIIELMEKNVETGDPVNPPIWWIAPNDPIALGCRADKEDHGDFADDETLQRSLSRDESYCKSEFLLGDRILVAPVVWRDARIRNIYLPEGHWKDGNSEKTYNGPIWIKNYPAGLDILPYFLRLWPTAL